MSDQWFAWKTVGDKVNRPNVKVTGKWTNRLGSTMTLQVRKGKLSGTYRTAVGAPGVFEEFPLTGFVSGDLISFTVNWQNYGCVTAWVGQHTTDVNKDNERIETMWHLAMNVAEEMEEKSMWGAFLTGQNIFVRESSTQSST